MRQLLLCLTLLLCGMCFPQQGQPPPEMQQPPYGTPPAFPDGRQIPGQQPTRPLPPDEEAPPAQAMSTQKMHQQITGHLRSEPALDHTNVAVQVSDSFVVLTGNVRSEEQKDLAVRIAQSYAGQRKVVDKIRVQQQT